MHYIQKHILDKLRKNETLRYTELNPGEIESGHFRYHLSQVTKEGYVTSKERGIYQLTNTGQHAVDRLSEEGVNLKPMPKVITYTLLRNGNQIMLQQKQKQPYINLLNFIGGKVHESESTQAAAIREVKEKTGLAIKNSSLMGIFEILVRSNSTLLTHAIAYVYISSIQEINPNDQSLKIFQMAELEKLPNLAPDFLAIFNRIKNAQSIQTDVIDITLQ